MSLLSFRRLSPKGLYARSVLLSLLPVMVVMSLMTIYYFNGHLRTINTKLSQSVAREIALIHENCRTDPGNMSVKASIELRLNIDYNCDYQPDLQANENQARFYYANLVRQQMDQILSAKTQLYMAGDGRQIDIRVPGNGTMLRAIVDRKRVVDINGHVFIVWVGAFSLFMIFAALAFLRNHVRSILRLTEAAQAFGRGQALEGFRPSGAREVRAAAHAVIEMRQRLTSFAEQRTMMLAGVSHDLRTPLARLQLQLAMQAQTEDVLQAREDVRDMEAMLEEYLAFARGEDGEQAELINITDIVRSLLASFPSARFVDTQNADHWVMARPMAIKRAISNLLQNATTYGDSAEIKVDRDPGMIIITVDDNGPGIPEARYEDAFRPFARLNEARTQNAPGVGLGLALTRDTARSHGGRVTLHRSPLGGLRAQMSLPL